MNVFISSLCQFAQICQHKNHQETLVHMFSEIRMFTGQIKKPSQSPVFVS